MESASQKEKVMSASPVASLQGVTFAYPGGEPVFQGFSWQVEHGESWAVIGPSGCGKTTLLYLLAGLRLPQAGKVEAVGAEVRGPRRSTGLILQDYGLLPWVTARENVALGLRVRRVPRRERRRIVDAWLDRLGLGGLGERYPGQLSGGQRQRVAIARTLALQPDLLLMDEPFSSLDALTREEFQSLALNLGVARGLTTVLVTHSIEEAVFLGQRILVLQETPLRRAEVVDNPGAGTSTYRASPEYHRVTQEVRRRIGAGEAITLS